MHISSSYAKILGETNFQPWEIPRSGSKAKDGREKGKRKWVLTMASYALQLNLGWRTQSRLDQNFICSEMTLCSNFPGEEHAE